MKRTVATIAAVCALAASTPAEAALTDSEKAQIRDFYSEGAADKAPRTRALLARPDLTPAEIREAFTGAAIQAPFDDKRRKFVHQLLFGPASQASRSELVVPVVESLLQRAQRLTTAGGDDAGRARELLRIHRFVAETVAPSAADPGGGQGAAPIRADALKAVVQAYKTYLAQPAMARANLNADLLPARAQAELAVVALAAGTVPTADIATWVTENADAQRILARSGILVHGLDGAPPAEARAVAQLVEQLPSATTGTSMLWIDKPRPTALAGAGAILVAQADLASDAKREHRALWSSSVESSSVDDAIAEVAFVVARRGASAWLRREGTHESAARKALARAKRQGEAGFLGIAAHQEALGGPPGDAKAAADAISPSSMLTHATQILMLDAPRTVAMALAGATAGRLEPIEQLALSLGVVATDAAGRPKSAVTVGKPGEGGGLAPIAITGIQGEAERITGFEIDGRVVRFNRTDDGAVTSVTVGGKPVVPSEIPLAKTPTTPGERWTPPAGSGVGVALFERLAGRVELGFPGAGKLVVRNSGEGPAAAVAIAGATEMRMQAQVASFSPKSEIVLRAQKGARAPAGIVIEWSAGERPAARVFARDATGHEEALGPAIELPAGGNPVAFAAVLGRDRLTLTVGAKKVEWALPPSVVAPAHLPTQLGDVAFSAPPGGELSLEAVSISGASKAAP